MTDPVATQPFGAASRIRRAVVGVALASLAACGGSSQVRKADFTPGRLDEQQLARCRELAEAYVARADDYEQKREAMRDDPVALGWFVRYLETDIVRVREGRAEITGRDTLRANPNDRRDIERQQGARVRQLREDDGPREWPIVGPRKDGDQDRRAPDERAIDEIVAIGEPAVEIVIHDLLLSGQEFLRTIAAEVLAGIGDPAVPALLRIVREGSSAEQRAAVRVLGAVGSDGDALRALAGLSETSEWRLRSEVAQALGGGGAGACAVLVGMVADEDAFVRRQVAKALARHVGERQAVDALIGMLGDEEAAVRRDAAEALGSHRGAVDAVRALVDFLAASQQRRDVDDEVAAQKGLQRYAGETGLRSLARWREFAAEQERDR